MKRILCFCLVISLLFSCFQFTGAAANYDNTEDATYNLEKNVRSTYTDGVGKTYIIETVNLSPYTINVYYNHMLIQHSSYDADSSTVTTIFVSPQSIPDLEAAELTEGTYSSIPFELMEEQLALDEDFTPVEQTQRTIEPDFAMDTPLGSRASVELEAAAETQGTIFDTSEIDSDASLEYET